MKLVPTHPPGRKNRKARAYAAEIWQLRAQGYTYEAIRQALADADVHVSTATVQREMARVNGRKTSVAPATTISPNDRPVSTPQTPQTNPSAPLALEPPTSAQDVAVPAVPRSGKEVAEAFMRNRITNPLIRSKERP